MSAQPLPEPDLPARHEEPETEALDIVEATPAPEGTEEVLRRRTPLSVVPARARKRRRLPFVLLCVLIVFGVIAAVLAMNVHVASTQYDLVQLDSKSQDLRQRNQQREQELNYAQAPQNLARHADEAGMVQAGRPGVVDLKRQRVTGKATASKKKEAGDADAKGGTTVSDPMSPDELAALSAKKQAAIREQNEKAAEARQRSAPPRQSEEESAPKQQEPQPDPTPAPARPESEPPSKQSAPKRESDPGKTPKSGFSKEELNGGSIPAPSTR